MVINNYICFGSNDKNDCIFKENEKIKEEKVIENLDKYAYRIIGIDVVSGEIKLTKMQALNTAYSWNYETGEQYTWNNTDLYKQLNGLHETKIFLTDISNYPYMQSKANVETSWTNLISNHLWKFGNVPFSSLGFQGIDTGILAYQKEIARWEMGSSEPYYAGEFRAKIGLMYAHDYWLSLGNTYKCHTEADVNDYEEYKNSWLYLWNINDYNAPNDSVEWTMTRSSSTNAWTLYNNGRITTAHFDNSGSYPTRSIRPVFYLISNIKLSGEGTVENPYTINYKRSIVLTILLFLYLSFLR